MGLLGSCWWCWGCCMVVCTAVKAAPSGAVALVLEACHGGCDVGGVGDVDVAGVCLEGG